MAIPQNINDREHQKFADVGGLPTVRVQGTSATAVAFANRLEKSVTMAAATTGAVASTPLLTITGVVGITMFAVVQTNLTSGGSATIEVGTATNTAGLLPQVAFNSPTATEIWHDATPDATIELASVIAPKIVSESVIYKIATATITGGIIKFFISWYPISSDGNVALA